MNETLKPEDISIRTELQAGDIGYVTWLHGLLYRQEYGYGISFESYVAFGLHEFYQQYDPDKDRVWVCEHSNQIIGFLLLMHRPENTAQLRFFILMPAYRGIGLGRKLMNLYMEFLVQKKYKHTYLWTTNEQDAAAYLYSCAGFTLTTEKESNAFGKSLREQRYDLDVKV